MSRVRQHHSFLFARASSITGRGAPSAVFELLPSLCRDELIAGKQENKKIKKTPLTLLSEYSVYLIGACADPSLTTQKNCSSNWTSPHQGRKLWPCASNLTLIELGWSAMQSLAPCSSQACEQHPARRHTQNAYETVGKKCASTSASKC